MFTLMLFSLYENVDIPLASFSFHASLNSWKWRILCFLCFFISFMNYCFTLNSFRFTLIFLLSSWKHWFSIGFIFILLIIHETVLFLASFIYFMKHYFFDWFSWLPLKPFKFTFMLLSISWKCWFSIGFTFIRSRTHFNTFHHCL